MAYIESHQELATHPKVKRAARMLDTSIPAMIGHLHLLWWWAFDHTFEAGDLSRYDEYDIADAAMWEGDPAKFVRALITCGSRGRAGFIDGDPVDNDTWRLHDWHVYTAAMRERREYAARANHVRHHEKKGVDAPDCPYCTSARSPGGLRADSEGTPQRSPDPLRADSTEPDLTEPDLPDLPNQPDPPARAATFPPPPDEPTPDNPGEDPDRSDPDDHANQLARRLGLQLRKRTPDDLTDALARCLDGGWTVTQLAREIERAKPDVVTSPTGWLTGQLAALAERRSPTRARERSHSQATSLRETLDNATEAGDRGTAAMADLRARIDALEPAEQAELEGRARKEHDVPDGQKVPRPTLDVWMAELLEDADA